jgi:isopentenyldiphosphate isomerase
MTLMADHEYFDILDCAGRKTGEVIARDEAHSSGTWHGAFHCLIISGRNGRGFALFQKRSAEKKIAPGKFDVSVGGHYTSGEDARIAGPREIREELGLNVRFEDLLPLGRRIFVYCFTPGVREYEFQDIFLLDRNVQPEEMQFQKEEVDGVLEMDLDAGIQLFTGSVPHIQCRFRNNDETLSVPVRAQDFVSCLDNYYLKLLLLARRYFQGERNTLFL